MKNYNSGKKLTYRSGRKTFIALATLEALSLGASGCATALQEVQRSPEQRLNDYNAELRSILRSRERGKISDADALEQIQALDEKYGSWDDYLEKVQEARESLNEYLGKKRALISEYAGKVLNEEVSEELETKLEALRSKYEPDQLRLTIYKAPVEEQSENKPSDNSIGDFFSNAWNWLVENFSVNKSPDTQADKSEIAEQEQPTKEGEL